MSAAVMAAVSLPTRYGDPNFLQGITQALNKNEY